MTCNPSTLEEAKDRLKDILRYKVSLRLAWTPGTLSQKHKSLQAEKQTMFSASMYVFIMTKLKNLNCGGA